MDASPVSSLRLRLASCPICGDPIDAAVDDENCPGCNQRGRIRSLGPVMEEVVWPSMDKALAGRAAMLAFSTTQQERNLVDHGITVRPTSLYADWGGSDNQPGVDVRDLHAFEDASLCGAYSILLFDYFLEHEQALGELARVIAPGGVFFTHIGSNRIGPGMEPPESQGEIEPESGGAEHQPERQLLLNVRVGRDWLIDAFGRSGFEPVHVCVEDAPTGSEYEWFVGRRPAESTAREGRWGSWARAASRRSAPQDRSATAAGPQPFRAAITRPAEELVHSVPVDPAFGFSRVVVRLALPDGARTGSFGEHVWNEAKQETTPTVIALYPEAIAISEDNGQRWSHVPLPALKDLEGPRCFTTSRGTHLIHAANQAEQTATLLRFGSDWTLLDSQDVGRAPWHARGAIGERNGVIMFAEYPVNMSQVKLVGDRRPNPGDPPPLSPRVYRSTDDGQTWNVAFEVDWREIRHFHNLVPDPFKGRTWWLSSGDRPPECRVWRTTDGGGSWAEVTNPNPQFDLGPHQDLAPACYRQTDLFITTDELFWGADDWLGGDSGDLEALLGRRTGARFFVSKKKKEKLDPRPLGWAGNPVRSLTDVGEALIATTEAKEAGILGSPQVFLISKEDLSLSTELFRTSVFGGRGSGFTYSRASRAARDGVFFTHRTEVDVFDRPGGILRWEVEFL